MKHVTTNINIRMDKDLKEQAERLLSELGMNMTTAFSIFLRQTVRQGGIPFIISINTGRNEKKYEMKKDPEAMDEFIAAVYASNEIVPEPERLALREVKK